MDLDLIAEKLAREKKLSRDDYLTRKVSEVSFIYDLPTIVYLKGTDGRLISRIDVLPMSNAFISDSKPNRNFQLYYGFFARLCPKTLIK